MTARALSEDDIVLAGEAALGLLDAASEAIAAARIATDPVFAIEVAAWQERFAPLLGPVTASPDPALWQALSTKIDAVPSRHAANTGLRIWQAIAGGATAVAATLAVMIANPPSRIPIASPTLVAALGSETGRAAMTAAYDQGRAELVVTPVAFEAGGRFPELWVIDQTGNAQSLGFVKADRATRVAVSPSLRARMVSGMTLAVTLEFDNAAPHVKAAGPIIVSGKIAML